MAYLSLNVVRLFIYLFIYYLLLNAAQREKLVIQWAKNPSHCFRDCDVKRCSGVWGLSIPTEYVNAWFPCGTLYRHYVKLALRRQCDWFIAFGQSWRRTSIVSEPAPTTNRARAANVCRTVYFPTARVDAAWEESRFRYSVAAGGGDDRREIRDDNVITVRVGGGGGLISLGAWRRSFDVVLRLTYI